jgi:Uma2 family endonuclease
MRAPASKLATAEDLRGLGDARFEVIGGKPSNAKNDLVDKLRAYQRARVPHYWIIDPDLQVLTVYRYRSGTYEVALTAGREETVHAEPFEAVALSVGVFFGDDTPPPAGR